MKFIERLVLTANAITNGALQKAFLEAAAQSATGDPDDYKYRRLSSALRDMMPVQYSKAAEMAFYLWQRNPLASRMIEIVVDFCVGEEFSIEIKVKKRQEAGPDIEVENEKPQRVWDSFCSDPVNNFYDDFNLLVQELFLFGELPLPATVNEMNGDVRLGFIDSSLIKEVIRDSTGRRVASLKLYEEEKERTFKVVNVDIVPESPTYGKRVGEILFFRVNRVLSQSRGHSDLIQSLDWIDALDQFLFNNLEGNALRNAFFYWLKMSGMKQEQIDKMRVAPPKPGTVKVTNEKAEWQVMTPDLKASDTAEATRMFKNFILAGKGYPEHWFADGGNTNLATAEQMAIPVMRMLKRKQRIVKSIAKEIAAFVLDQKLIKNPGALGLAEDEYLDITVNAFDFSRDDSSVIASGFVQTVTALVAAAGKGWVSDDNAKKIVDGNLSRLGIEVDPNETVEDIKEKNKSEEDESAYDDLPDPNDFFNKDKK